MFERPATIGELAGALERAERSGRRVRVAGSGHSFTGLVVTDGTLISLERMNRMLDVDSRSGLARVEAGISLGSLNAQLDHHGLALENLGDIDVQSLAGATATGTHGTGQHLRNLSSQLKAVELMLADGSTVTLTEQSDPDGWRAARISLGALGVVTAVTLQAVPAFRLRGVDGPMPLEETLDRLDELVGAHDHFEFYTFPHSPTALLRRNDRTDEPAAPRSALRSYLEDILLVNHTLDGFCRLGRRVPALIPSINRLVTRLAGSSRRVDASHRIFVSPRLVRFTEMEYAIPRAHAAEAVRAVRRAIEVHRFAVSFPIEVRFVAGDDALLSPPTSATRATSPSTCTTGWSSSRTSARSRKSWTRSTAGRTGVSGTSRPPRRSPPGTRNGAASRASDGASTHPGVSPTRRSTACSAHDQGSHDRAGGRDERPHR